MYTYEYNGKSSGIRNFVESILMGYNFVGAYIHPKPKKNKRFTWCLIESIICFLNDADFAILHLIDQYIYITLFLHYWKINHVCISNQNDIKWERNTTDSSYLFHAWRKKQVQHGWSSFMWNWIELLLILEENLK